jgi:hypothetical protein
MCSVHQRRRTGHRSNVQRASQPPCGRRIAATCSVHRSRRVGVASQHRAACIAAAVWRRVAATCSVHQSRRMSGASQQRAAYIAAALWGVQRSIVQRAPATPYGRRIAATLQRASAPPCERRLAATCSGHQRRRVSGASQQRAAHTVAAVWAVQRSFAAHRSNVQRTSRPPCRRRSAASCSVHRSRGVVGASQQRAACISAAVWSAHRSNVQRASAPPCERRIAATCSVHQRRLVGGAAQHRAAYIAAAVGAAHHSIVQCSPAPR